MTQNKKKLQLMREGEIPVALCKLGLPPMIGMLVSALYNLVDAYFVGGLGTSQLAAVSVVFPVVQIIIGLGMTFGSGAASYAARLLGEKNEEQANKTVSTALFTSIAVGIIAIVLALCFLDNFLLALGATNTILPFARAYALIYISGSIFNIFNVTMNNIIAAEGATKVTMTAMLMGAILNAVLDPIFIYNLDFGIEGAAIATVIAQAITSLMYVIYIVGKKGYLSFSIWNFCFDKHIYGEIFKIGVPTLVFQLLSSASISLTNTAASSYGDSAVASMGIVTRILAMGTYIVFGYMKGFQPVAGFNYGAKRYDRLKEAVRVSLKWATTFCMITAVVLLVFAPYIVSAFSQGDSTVIEIGSAALRANSILFVFFGFSSVYMSLFLALGKGKEGSILSMSRQGLFFIPTILIMPLLLGLNGVIYAQPLADLFTVILTLILSVRLNKSMKYLETAVLNTTPLDEGI